MARRCAYDGSGRWARPVPPPEADAMPTGNSRTGDRVERVRVEDPRYPELVAQPVMAAVDGMPEAYRACVHEYGYVDVYRAWRRGIAPEQIRESAERNGGRFVL